MDFAGSDTGGRVWLSKGGRHFPLGQRFHFGYDTAITIVEITAAAPMAGFGALHFLRQADIRTGRKVLIMDAPGSIGAFSVQLAGLLGGSRERLVNLRLIHESGIMKR